MFRRPERVTVLSLAKKTMVMGLVLYGAATTVLLVRLKPQPLLVGIDAYGTRIIRESGDRLLKKERENFLKHFLALLYNYDSETFDKRISDGGDLMATALWKEKREEFERIARQIKTESVAQAAEVQELREVDDGAYQADLLIRVQRRLTETTVKLRVEIRIRPNTRRENNPYPYEVERYDEQQAT